MDAAVLDLVYRESPVFFRAPPYSLTRDHFLFRLPEALLDAPLRVPPPRCEPPLAFCRLVPPPRPPPPPEGDERPLPLRYEDLPLLDADFFAMIFIPPPRKSHPPWPGGRMLNVGAAFAPRLSGHKGPSHIS